MKKGLKICKKVILILLVIIVLIIVGLIINNRIYYIKYSSNDIGSDTLTKDEINTVKDIYTWISENGNKVFDGFDDSIELIIFNRSYEFLFAKNQYGNWDYVSSGFGGKNIYRRKADNPQAFAVKIDNKWVGSFNTHNFFNVSLLEQIPLIIPPQLFNYDKIGYRSIVVHEMLHAYQGICDYDRVDKAEHLKNICGNKNQDGLFNSYIEEEAKILEEAIKSNNPSVYELVQKFVEVRDKRYEECGLSQIEISNEQEFEWLEGCARYAEYIASEGSSSSISKELGNIFEKVKIQDDDRYYTLGMAQILLIKKLNISNWQQKILYKGYTPEQLIREYIAK